MGEWVVEGSGWAFWWPKVDAFQRHAGKQVGWPKEGACGGRRAGAAQQDTLFGGSSRPALASTSASTAQPRKALPGDERVDEWADKGADEVGGPERVTWQEPV